MCAQWSDVGGILGPMTGAPDPVEPRGACYLCGLKTNTILSWGGKWEYLCKTCCEIIRVEEFLDGVIRSW